MTIWENHQRNDFHTRWQKLLMAMWGQTRIGQKESLPIWDSADFSGGPVLRWYAPTREQFDAKLHVLRNLQLGDAFCPLSFELDSSPETYLASQKEYTFCQVPVAGLVWIDGRGKSSLGHHSGSHQAFIGHKSNASRTVEHMIQYEVCTYCTVPWYVPSISMWVCRLLSSSLDFPIV